MDYLLNPCYGAGLQLLKIEIGGRHQPSDEPLCGSTRGSPQR
ncbi:hypothetical protein [Kitasatospora sp. NPDC085879]